MGAVRATVTHPWSRVWDPAHLLASLGHESRYAVSVDAEPGREECVKAVDELRVAFKQLRNAPDHTRRIDSAKSKQSYADNKETNQFQQCTRQSKPQHCETVLTTEP